MNSDSPEIPKKPEAAIAPKKKSSYSDRFKQDMIATIEQLELTDLQRRFMKARWLDQLSWLSGRAKHSQKWYYRLRLMTIIGGVVIPALVSLNINDTKTRTYAVWLTFGLSQIVAISAAVDEFFHYGDRWNQYRQTSERLKAEGWQFFQLSGSYQSFTTHQEAYINFANRVETIIQSDVDNYAELLRQKQEETQKANAATVTQIQSGVGTLMRPVAVPPGPWQETPVRNWQPPVETSIPGMPTREPMNFESAAVQWEEPEPSFSPPGAAIMHPELSPSDREPMNAPVRETRVPSPRDRQSVPAATRGPRTPASRDRQAAATRSKRTPPGSAINDNYPDSTLSRSPATALEDPVFPDYLLSEEARNLEADLMAPPGGPISPDALLESDRGDFDTDPRLG